MVAIEDWDQIVTQILAGDSSGQQALYEAFAPGLRLFLLHHLQREEDVEDRLHDIFVSAVSVLQGGQLREPDRLAGFMRTIARRHLAAFIEQAVEQRETGGELLEGLTVVSPAPSPEQMAIDRQFRERALEVLGSFPRLDREVLIRFYLRGQEPEEICRELGLTSNQFRLRKSRAKRRFENSMRKKTAAAH